MKPGTAYFFNRTKYVRVDHLVPGEDTDVAGVGPVSIFSGWKSLKEAGFDSVDAVLKMDGGIAYFFRGTQYIRVDGIEVGKDTDYLAVKPTEIFAGWRSLKEANFETIDAILPMGGGVAYFFSGTRYIRVGHIAVGKNTDTLDVATNDISTRWPSLKAAGFYTIDAALSIGAKDAYFFSGSQYARVTITDSWGDALNGSVAQTSSAWASLRNFW